MENRNIMNPQMYILLQLLVTNALCDPYKLAWLYPGPISDYGWNNAMERGRTYVDDKLFEMGIDSISDYRQNLGSFPDDTPKAEEAIEEYMEEDYDMIIGGSFFWMDSLVNTSIENPDKHFLHFTGYKQTANLNSVFQKAYQGFYIAGLMCGEMTNSNTIGFMAPFRVAEVLRHLNAFYIGAKQRNPDIKVQVWWTDDWYSPLVEAEAARRLYDSGCDCISGSQDSVAIPEVAAELDFWAIGYSGDFRILANENTLTSILLNWGPLVLENVIDAINGTWVQQDVWEGFEVGAVSLAPYSTKMPNYLKTIVNDAETKLTAGDDSIFCIGNIPSYISGSASGECLNSIELHTMDWIFPDIDERGEIELSEVIVKLYPRLNDTVGILVLIFSSVLVLSCFVFAIDMALHMRSPVYFSSSVHFLALILVGNLLGAISIFFWILEPSFIVCQMRVWLFGLGFILVFGNLFAKNYRISRIFGADLASNNAAITNSVLFVKYSLVVIVLEVVILLVWALLDPVIRIELGPDKLPELAPNELYIGCSSTTHYGFLVFGIFNSLILLVGAAIAYRVRKVPTEFSELKAISFSVSKTIPSCSHSRYTMQSQYHF
eukprot:TRINITY_DN7987_c0_g1_i2.p1 TRINITY_DN7987_c0_g1~~TRINITY_DN7987_c0_g1_i2.p1  ORF type:complete len:604 (+),score=101.74 TRINITY_DN7987_c0_g1_i2:86-1897(+)